MLNKFYSEIEINLLFEKCTIQIKFNFDTSNIDYRCAKQT